ncbi:hypothetical protein [Myroides odoratimimus]|uniref:hypothetical protein n=1 Tax=Myroides odoratimimus TaxID=76832 RepID=UPI000916C7CA|nr:hypothetical protein [Myroides odoratimimus]SHL56194.1 hypothetical protein SAMN05444275_10529 [Myroides odoratimimus subsp. xuanwuensis]
MKYRINLNNNYPNKMYGMLLCEENLLYYVFFMKPDKLNLNIRIDFLDFYITERKWDCIPTDKANIYLINQRVIDLLNLHYMDTFELLDASIYSNHVVVETEYRLLHVLNHVDNDKIIYKDSIWVDEGFIKDYKKNKLKGWVFSREDE